MIETHIQAVRACIAERRVKDLEDRVAALKRTRSLGAMGTDDPDLTRRVDALEQALSKCRDPRGQNVRPPRDPQGKPPA